jgi:hypothetical protein
MSKKRPMTTTPPNSRVTRGQLKKLRENEISSVADNVLVRRNQALLQQSGSNLKELGESPYMLSLLLFLCDIYISKKVSVSHLPPSISFVDFVAMFDNFKSIRREKDFMIISLENELELENIFASMAPIEACRESGAQSNRKVLFRQGFNKHQSERVTSKLDRELRLSSRGLHLGDRVSICCALGDVVEEGPHCDFGPTERKGNAAGHIIYAVSEGVRVLVKCDGKKEEILIPKSHCLIMDSQCVHARSGYNGSSLVLSAHHQVYLTEQISRHVRWLKTDLPSV